MAPVRTYSELRRDIAIPRKKKTVEVYFTPRGDKFRGRLITTLPAAINKDLCRTPARELKLKTMNDLDHLRSIAEDGA